MKRKSKLLGLSTLALAGVLAFSGCGKTEEKKVEKVELVESNETSNKYKVTYTDGSSETFEEAKSQESQVKELTREEADSVFQTAILNTIAVEEFEGVVNGIVEGEQIGYSLGRFDGVRYLKYGTALVYHKLDGYYYVINEDGSKEVIESRLYEPFSAGEPGVSTEGIHSAATEVFNSMWYMHTSFTNVVNISALEAMIKNDISDSISDEDITLTQTCVLENGKYTLTVSAKANVEGNEGVATYTYTFTDKLESIKIVITNSEDYDLNQLYVETFSYAVDETIKNVDFTTFPESDSGEASA